MKGAVSQTSFHVLVIYTVAMMVYIVTFSDAEYQVKLSNSFWLNTGLQVGSIQSHF